MQRLLLRLVLRAQAICCRLFFAAYKTILAIVQGSGWLRRKDSRLTGFAGAPQEAFQHCCLRPSISSYSTICITFTITRPSRL